MESSAIKLIVTSQVPSPLDVGFVTVMLAGGKFTT